MGFACGGEVLFHALRRCGQGLLARRGQVRLRWSRARGRLLVKPGPQARKGLEIVGEALRG
jgi:hypothetical protein